MVSFLHFLFSFFSFQPSPFIIIPPSFLPLLLLLLLLSLLPSFITPPSFYYYYSSSFYYYSSFLPLLLLLPSIIIPSFIIIPPSFYHSLFSRLPLIGYYQPPSPLPFDPSFIILSHLSFPILIVLPHVSPTSNMYFPFRIVQLFHFCLVFFS